MLVRLFGREKPLTGQLKVVVVVVVEAVTAAAAALFINFVFSSAMVPLTARSI